MTDIAVSIIMVAIVAVLVTRPGTADAIKGMSAALTTSIKALLGADYE